MTYAELKELLYDQSEICRATLPTLAEKPDNEKTLDDFGLEYLMSGFLFLYDDYPNPSDEQMQQLKQTAAAASDAYRGAMSGPEGKDDEEALLNLNYGFLLLYSFKVSNNKAKMN